MSEGSLSPIEKKVVTTLRNVMQSGYGSVNIAVKDKQVVDLVPSFKTDLEELKELQRA
jgi:hypothetical protein